MNARFIRISAILTALVFISQLTPAAAQQTTPIQQGSQTGTQTVSSSTAENGDVTTTTTTDLSGPLNDGNAANNAMTGAVRGTDHDEVSVTKDSSGHELDRTETHVHENIDKDGHVIGRTTRTWKVHTDWKTGTRTTTATTLTENKNTGETTDDHFTSEDSWFGGHDGHWEHTGGHQTVTVEKNGEKKKTIDRNYDWSSGKWINKTLSLLPVLPQADGSATTEQVFAPSISGPSSEIVATVVDPNQNIGPSDQVVVQFDDHQGTHHFMRTFTDPDGRVNFRLPEYAAAVGLFLHFTRDRRPDPQEARFDVNPHAIVPGTDAVPNAENSGVSITRATSAYQPGGSNTVDLQTIGTDPLRSSVMMDGSNAEVQTVAASNLETKGRLADDTPLGRHVFTVRSGKTSSNAVPADVVALRADPIGIAETGQEQTVTVHCDGLPESDSGIMYFQVGGAAQLSDGGATTAVPVKSGVAQVRIRGVHSGAALVRFKLHAQIPGFWS